MGAIPRTAAFSSNGRLQTFRLPLFSPSWYLPLACEGRHPSPVLACRNNRREMGPCLRRGAGRCGFAEGLRGIASSREPLFHPRREGMSAVAETVLRTSLDFARELGEVEAHRNPSVCPERSRGTMRMAIRKQASGSRTPRLLAGNERVGHPASDTGLTLGSPIRCDLVHTQFSFARIAHPCIFIDEP